MADVHDKETRSFNMSRIKGKNTKPELIVRKYLHAHGLRYRLHAAGMPGKPDIVLAKYKTVVFVHGCFWHRHDGCRYFVVPKTRTDFWMNKIERNVSNDTKQRNALQAAGWQVLTIWECELKPSAREKSLVALFTNIIGDATS